MNKISVLLLCICLLAGCGGSSGGGGTQVSTTIVGQVLDVTTGGPVTGVSVTAPGFASVNTKADGSFSLSASPATTSITVDATKAGYGAWSFTFVGSSGTVDLGQLWVGPTRVTLTGKVIDSTTGVSVAGAAVSFAGLTTATANDGTFSLYPVPYNGADLPVFWGIAGSVTATSYFTETFTAGDQRVSAGIVAVGDILITPSNNPNPPGQPYSITGYVEPIGNSTGTVVTLLSSGTPVRVFNVGANGQYFFWIGPGAYTITFKDGALSAPTQAVTVTSLGAPVTVPSVTLH